MVKTKEQIDFELKLCKTLLLELDVSDKQVVVLGLILGLVEAIYEKSTKTS